MPEFSFDIVSKFDRQELKNAVNQGRSCVDTIAGRLAGSGGGKTSEVFDLLIIGAGPAGISSRRVLPVYANGATVGATTRTPRQTIRAPWHCGHANTDCRGPKLQRCGAPGRRRFTQIHKPL